MKRARQLGCRGRWRGDYLHEKFEMLFPQSRQGQANCLCETSACLWRRKLTSLPALSTPSAASLTPSAVLLSRQPASQPGRRCAPPPASLRRSPKSGSGKRARSTASNSPPPRQRKHYQLVAIRHLPPVDLLHCQKVRPIAGQFPAPLLLIPAYCQRPFTKAFGRALTSGARVASRSRGRHTLKPSSLAGAGGKQMMLNGPCVVASLPGA